MTHSQPGKSGKVSQRREHITWVLKDEYQSAWQGKYLRGDSGGSVKELGKENLGCWRKRGASLRLENMEHGGHESGNRSGSDGEGP